MPWEFRDSLSMGPQTTVGWSESAIFGNFGRHIYRAVRVEANTIMRCHELPHQLSSDRKMLDLDSP